MSFGVGVVLGDRTGECVGACVGQVWMLLHELVWILMEVLGCFGCW